LEGFNDFKSSNIFSIIDYKSKGGSFLRVPSTNETYELAFTPLATTPQTFDYSNVFSNLPTNNINNHSDNKNHCYDGYLVLFPADSDQHSAQYLFLNEMSLHYRMLIPSQQHHRNYKGNIKNTSQQQQQQELYLPCVLVGTKSDIAEEQRKFSIMDGIKVADRHQSIYLETSIVNNEGVDLCMEELVKRIEIHRRQKKLSELKSSSSSSSSSPTTKTSTPSNPPSSISLITENNSQTQSTTKGNKKKLMGGILPVSSSTSENNEEDEIWKNI